MIFRGKDNVKMRSKTIPPYKLTAEELRLKEELDATFPQVKVENRSQCRCGPRPCPIVSCKYHLYTDIKVPNGSLVRNFGFMEIDLMNESCVLDVAERGAHTLEEIGEMLNLTRERIRQIERDALKKLEPLGGLELIKEYLKAICNEQSKSSPFI